MIPAEVTSEIIKTIIDKAKVGVNLLELEKTAEIAMTLRNVKSANKGYKPSWTKNPFPSVICLGVNDIIAHSPPYNYFLKDGDLLTIDCGIIVDNMAGDAGITIPIGNISNRDQRLLRYTKMALYEGLKVIKPNVKINEVGRTIEKFVNFRGYVVNRILHGHGIGKQMHEEPLILNFDIGKEEIITIDKKGKKKYLYKAWDNIPSFYEGQIVCIEPYSNRP